ncbi:MAG: TetR family transcriptional regulator [Bacteroidota bacterium]
MSVKTTQKIVSAAIELFNEQGFGSPSLYQLSQALGMSRSNLTYHFKNKEALLRAIVDEMSQEYEAMMAQTTQHPSWESTNNSTLAFHDLQKKYAFIFFDRQLLSISQVKAQIIRIKAHHLQWQLSIIRFSIQIGNMKMEVIPGTYHNLCRTIWSTSFFWLMSEVYKTEESEKDWGRYVWSIILPHFTDKGVTAFRQHFGEDYYTTLGPAFLAESSVAFGL